MSEDTKGPLERYLSILEVVLASGKGLTVAELGQILDLPKATTHRLLAALNGAKVLDVAEEGRRTYRAGARLARMLTLGTDENMLINFCQVVCNELVNELEETCYVVKLSSKSAYAVAVAVTDHSYRLHVMPGSEMPLHAAASSRILLAYQDDAARRRYLGAPLEKITPLTKVRLADVLATINEARRNGYATCLGEVDPSTMAYAVPVFSPGGVIYAVGVTGPQFRISKWPHDELLQRLRSAADKLRRMLEMSTS
ncbi:IclR family transcriptional regulator [Cupriavidus numazuensis]|uniref:IclR family transcriptional regulator n=1 Tax=Cupriavidus numazuensis TaxID=221992 RepID=A0ABN7Q7S1_9BURK|nr:IclR family transcriptional regulator [Cupriavidus numazuensis]CAG2153187.1 hypothetical protein LMG26411_04348 [Cupriavidus numazuensis]